VNTSEPLSQPRRGCRVRPSGLVRLAVALGVTCGVAFIGITPVSALPGSGAKARVTFGIEPATAHRADARPHFAFGVTPGATLNDHVALLNYSNKPLSLQLYATDAINTSNGGFGLLPATTKPVGAGAWITLPRHTATVRVPAQSAKHPGKVIVPFTLKVPDNATPGDHVGGIVASLRTAGQSSDGQNIILEQRVGTRLFIRVAGTLAPKISLTGLHATYHGTINPIGRGYVTVSFLIRNTGNVELGVQPDVSVSGLLGGHRRVDLTGIPLLLPGDSLRETGRVSGVWPTFTLRATVTAQPLVVAGDTDPRLLSASASTRLWAVPWTLIALLLVLVAAVGLAFRIRSQRRRPKAQPEPAEAVRV
jgi:Bacterial protein of unknown function (DUF916)